MKTRIHSILLALSSVFLLQSCYEKPCLPPPLQVEIDPVFEGETLHLVAEAAEGATFTWTGPNNFISNEQNPSIPDVTLALSGEYTCTVKVGKCEARITRDVQVLAAPPCQPQYNSIAFTNSAPYTFTSIRLTKNMDDRWQIVGTGSMSDFSITFFNADPIMNGSRMYRIGRDGGGSYAWIKLHYAGSTNSGWSSDPYAWSEAMSGSLYVNVIDGEMTVTFCEAAFTDSSYASGKVGTF